MASESKYLASAGDWKLEDSRDLQMGVAKRTEDQIVVGPGGGTQDGQALGVSGEVPWQGECECAIGDAAVVIMGVTLREVRRRCSPVLPPLRPVGGR